MNNEWTNERWEAAIRTVFRRALLDPEFRELARNEPRRAFQNANGIEPPAGARFRFVEALDEHVYVLPNVTVPEGTLSEIDLARILHHSYRQQSIPPIYP